MRRFSPTIKNTMATLVVLPILVGLGIWQLDRASEKRALAKAYAISANRPPMDISQLLAEGTDNFEWLPVSGSGHYRSPNILLDNRIRKGVVGYEILTPMQLGEITVLINRGWIAAPANRSELPDLEIPEGKHAYQGRLGPAPATGVAINKYSQMIERLSDEVIRIQMVNIDNLAEYLKEPLIKGVVYLNSEVPQGYLRDWRAPGFKPEKHEAYATQWFSMAAIVLVLYVTLNLRSREQTS